MTARPAPAARRPSRPAGDPEPRVDARRILVIHNPTAGWRRPQLLRDLVARLRAADREVVVMPTAHPGHAVELAAAAGDQGWDLVVAAGGDGTINEVLNGLSGSGLPLALCPLGTANVLALEIGLRPDAVRLASAILGGRTSAVAVGSCDGTGIADRAFVQMLGAGFDAQVVADVSRGLKRRLGRWAYVLMSLRAALRYHYPVFEVQLDGEAHRACSVIVANGRYYGGPYISAPAADLRRAELQVCLFHRGGPLHVARYGLALLTGRLWRLRDVSIHAATRIEITAPAGEPVQGDGDTFGSTPVSVAVRSARQLLVVPEER